MRRLIVTILSISILWLMFNVATNVVYGANLSEVIDAVRMYYTPKEEVDRICSGIKNEWAQLKCYEGYGWS